MILEPGSVPVVERAICRDEETNALLLTAQIRGLVEVLYDNIPTGEVSSDGAMDLHNPFQKSETHWKLTDSGWGVIQRRHQTSILSLLITMVGVLISVVLALT